jgi:predicted nucleic acid-binding protein
MAFVLDSSVALAWLLPDEDSGPTDRLADRLEREPVYAPSIWSLEVGNVLLTAQRRGRITRSELGQLAGQMAAPPVEVDAGIGAVAFGAVLQLARECRLTTYDAAYLELARRRSVALATLDVPLRQACAALKIPSLP